MDPFSTIFLIVWGATAGIMGKEAVSSSVSSTTDQILTKGGTILDKNVDKLIDHSSKIASKAVWVGGGVLVGSTVIIGIRELYLWRKTGKLEQEVNQLRKDVENLQRLTQTHNQQIAQIQQVNPPFNLNQQ